MTADAGRPGTGGRRTGKPISSITVPTPWYPTAFNRMGGSFVAEHARLVHRLADTVRVVHAQEWPGGKAAAGGHQPQRAAFDAVLARLAAAGGLRVTGVAGPVDRVPVFTVGGSTIPERAEAMVRDVRRAVGGFDSPVVHGHVGYWGGLLAARLADPSAAVFATEHSTGLRAVLDDPAGRDHYAELCERATAVFCVSGLLRDQVLAVLPRYADVVRVLHNPVEFRDVPQRAAPPERLDRWVFVGGLIERKGVERLVRAFCALAPGEPRLELTMYGDGPLADRLRALATDSGVADRLHLRGVVPHSQVLAELPDHDLLLAPSEYETFHLAVVEGVAAGLPVIVTRSGGPQEALAGVEDLVGRFVDVEDSPDALIDAYRELSDALPGLDVDRARKQLDARFGPEAIAARLAEAYGTDSAQVAPAGGEPSAAAPPSVEGVPADPSPGGVAPVGAAPVDPERVVLLAASAWRRYSVQEELTGCRTLGVPTVVVTGDPEVTAWSKGLHVVGPAAVDAAPPDPLPIRARRVAGRVKRRLQGRPSAAPPRGARLTDKDLDGATVLVTDCQSMSIAQRLLAVYPGARLAVELDRGGLLGPPPDAADG